MNSKYNDFILDKYIKNQTNNLYMKVKELDKLDKTNITILEKDILDNCVSLYINLLNKIRYDNLDKALEVKLPMLGKKMISFKNNYDNYYQYLYLLFDNCKNKDYYKLYIEIAIIIDKFNCFI